MGGNILANLGSWAAFTFATNGITTLANGSATASDAIDNSSNLYLDAFIFFKATSNGAPSGNKQGLVYAYGWDGTTYSDGLTPGSTFPANTPLNVAPAMTMSVTLTSTLHAKGPVLVGFAFGGALPDKWGVGVKNDSGQAFQATTQISWLPIYAKYT